MKLNFHAALLFRILPVNVRGNLDRPAAVTLISLVKPGITAGNRVPGAVGQLRLSVKSKKKVVGAGSKARLQAGLRRLHSLPGDRQVVVRDRAADVRWGPSLCRERLDFSPLRRD